MQPEVDPTIDSPASDDEKLAKLLSDLTERAQRGEHIDLEAVCRDNPTMASDLRHLWGAVMVAEVAGKSSSTDPLRGRTISGVSELTSAALSLPCRLGDYELLEELGRGGMGVVFRARQISLNREVAVKMILRDMLASAADRTRFQAEAEAAARLEHPGIVPVYQVGEFDGRPYFSMKFVRGQTLLQRLNGEPMPPREIATMLAKVARAIEFAHRRGVFHRDIKPSNILIDEQGEPHVTDFGLAKQSDRDASVTRSGAIVGTPAYMAPEQANGARGIVGPHSDVYSLGAVLYHMLTGRPPFQAASPVDTVLLVLEQDPVPPRIVRPLADPDLEMICLQCLQKPTDLRYASAGALADDLEAYLKNEPISARSGRITQVVAWWLRETHHAVVLQNWGLLWMWHSLVLAGVSFATNLLFLIGVRDRIQYSLMWTLGLGTWAAVFWMLRRRMGPVTFVERQIAHVWAASMVGTALLFPLEALLGLDVLKLSPVLAIISGMVFMVKAGILSGEFYVQAIVLFATTAVMAVFPNESHFIFGFVAALCFFLPGLKYYRQRLSLEGR